MPPTDGAIDWEEARRFLRERIAVHLRPLDGPTLDDLTQEALVRLLRASRREEILSPNGLMHEIARRTCVDMIRRRRRWNELLKELFGHAMPEVPQDHRDGPMLGDPLERLRFTVMEYFRVNEAPCLHLAEAYFDGQDWQTVAARAGRSHAAIRKQWSRCVMRLRQAARRNPGWLADWVDGETE